MENFFIILLFIMFLGCQKEECRVSDVVPIGIDAVVCSTTEMENDEDVYRTDTKTSYTNGSTAAWANGDAIGLYCAQSAAPAVNNKYTVSGVGTSPVWTPTTSIYWKNATTTHTFYAYYPYNTANTSTMVTIPILNNQMVATTAPFTPDATCDMLVAGPKNQVRTASVPLTFTHAFSLLQFNVKLGSLLNLYVLNNITIQGGNTSGGSNPYGIVNTVNSVSQIGYNIASQSIQATTNTSAVYAQSLSRNLASFSLLTNTTPFYFLVIPGTYANPVPGVKFTVALLGLISTSKNFVNLSPPGNTFAPNTKYTYSVTVGGIIDNAPEHIKVTFVSQEPITSNDISIN